MEETTLTTTKGKIIFTTDDREIVLGRIELPPDSGTGIPTITKNQFKAYREGCRCLARRISMDDYMCKIDVHGECGYMTCPILYWLNILVGERRA